MPPSASQPFARTVSTIALVAAAGIAAWLGWRAWSQTGVATRAAAETTTSPSAAAGEIERENGASSTPERRVAIAGEPTRGAFGRLQQAGRALSGATVQTDDDASPPARSGEDGAFALPGLDGFRGDLVLEGPTIPAGFRFGPIHVASGSVFDLGVIEVPEAAQIAGRVVDERGAPIAGVAIFAERSTTWEPPDAGAPDARTDGDGRFAFGGLLPGSLELRLEHPDHFVLTEACAPRGGQRLDLGEFALRDADPLHGVVIDERGQPIEAARVVPGGGRGEFRRLRQAVWTDATGAFELRARDPVLESLTIDKLGFQTCACEPLAKLTMPLRVTLQDALVLEGVVLGAEGRPCLIYLDRDRGERAPTWIDEHTYVPMPVAADGRFEVSGLPAGRWRVGVHSPGVGTVAPVSVGLPQREPLRLQLVPERELLVQVEDAGGTAIAGARVTCVAKGRAQYDALVHDLPFTWQARTGADGRAQLRVPAAIPARIRASAPGFFGDAAGLLASATETSVLLPMHRAAHMHGKLHDATWLAHVNVDVRFQRVDDKEDTWRAVPDSQGRWDSGPTRPGRYRVWVSVQDAREPSHYDAPVREPVALLGDRQAVTPSIEVEVVAGQNPPIELPPLRLLEVRGTVSSSRGPSPGAVVFVQRGAGEPSPYRLPLHPRQNCIVVRADAEGRYHFVSAEDVPIELRARAASGVTWTEPVAVAPTGDARAVRRDLLVPAGEIRGSFDRGTLPPIDRRDARVELYGIGDADAPPRESVWTTEASLERRSLAQSLTPQADGTFAFEGLPAGTWVLRLSGCGDDWPRVIVLADAEVVDVGHLVPPEHLPLVLTSGLPAGHGVDIRRVIGDDEVFVRGVRPRDGHLPWGALPPGRYRLRACLEQEISMSGPYGVSTFRKLGAPVGEPVELHVRDDGSCSPPRVWPDGLRD